MTEQEFLLQLDSAFVAHSSPTYTGSQDRKFSPPQKKEFFTSVWKLQSVHDKEFDKVKLVKELVKRRFDCEQDRVDFILAFLA